MGKPADFGGLDVHLLHLRNETELSHPIVGRSDKPLEAVDKRSFQLC